MKIDLSPKSLASYLHPLEDDMLNEFCCENMPNAINNKDDSVILLEEINNKPQDDSVIIVDEQNGGYEIVESKWLVLLVVVEFRVSVYVYLFFVKKYIYHPRRCVRARKYQRKKCLIGKCGAKKDEYTSKKKLN